MKTFEITATKHDGDTTLKIESASIIGALEKAHKAFQIDAGLKPDQYKLTKACHVYYGISINDVIRSGYDIPGGPNPTIEIPEKRLTSAKSK